MDQAALRAIVGTAGHVDHGKTRLVEALTGIDCDRWSEEKERGITIDLGFAHLRDGDLQVGFVDVPGHERFVHNALAGLGGVGVVLLVVAADEGVKPQTREHLDVCSLLGISTALVALSKSDLVSSDLLELARLEIEELLAATPLEGSGIVPVSALTGDGLPELRRRLLDLARRRAAAPVPDRPARLPIDRAFHLQGLGVVVTGTLAAGTVAAGDTLRLLPAGLDGVRVRAVQVHGEVRAAAHAGERTALQVTGVELGRIHRGQQLTAPNGYDAAVSVLVRFRLLESAPKPVSGTIPIRFHLLSSEVVGRLRPLSGSLAPGDEGIAEVRLARPVTAVRGDRFVVRRPSPAMTLGGGRVLDPGWRRPRGEAGRRAVAALAAGEDDALLEWAAQAGEAGLAADEVARRLGRPLEETAQSLRSLADRQKLLAAPPGHGHGALWLVPAAYARVGRRAERVLRDYFRRDRLSRGMPKAEAVERIMPGRSATLADVYLTWLAAQGVIAVDGGRVTLPGRRARLDDEESALATALVERYERAGLEPPAPAVVASELGAKPQIVDGVTRYLRGRGKLSLLPGGLLIAASAVDRVVADLRGGDWERFSVGDFKQRYGLTRKFAIPLLEHLDSTGVTRRLGNERMVVRSRSG